MVSWKSRQAVGRKYKSKMRYSIFKIQDANGKIENVPWDPRGGGASEPLGLRPAAVDDAQRSQSATLALLPFAFCVLTFAFALFLLPAPLRAQGCAMCYTSASAARSTAKEALANGTLILLIPPMVFFALISVVVYRYRNKFREPANWRPEHERELQEMLAELVPAKGVQEIGGVEDRVIR
jgi:hypothetical protein